jgi:hypothetical protein
MKRLMASLLAVPLLATSASAGTPLNDRQLDTVTAGVDLFTGGEIRIDGFIIVYTDFHPCTGICPQVGLSVTLTATTPSQTIVTTANTLGVK